jgi:fucose 4-O-acetylase-like acetyltransferase
MSVALDRIPIASRANSMNQPTPYRLYAMDSAKGIGILLVVFGHAWRGAFGAGLFPDTSTFAIVDAAIYAFHMPLFFFLAGLLFLDTLKKYGATTLLRGRLTRLLWPMVLWSWIFFGLKLGAGQAANTPVTIADFPLIPLPPYEHLWFLWALFQCQTLLIVLYVVFGTRIPTQYLRYGLGAAAVVMALLNPYTPVPSLIWGQMVEHMPYFLAGIAMGGLGRRAGTPLMDLVFGFGFIVMLTSFGGAKPSVIISLALVLMAWQAWAAVDQSEREAGPILRGLRYLGQVSMVIYLTHTAFSAALRIAMLKLDLNGVWFVVSATTLIGVIAPLAVLWCARRAGIIRLLGF